jgi:hypothetical protein
MKKVTGWQLFVYFILWGLLVAGNTFLHINFALTPVQKFILKAISTGAAIIMIYATFIYIRREIQRDKRKGST